MKKFIAFAAALASVAVVPAGASAAPKSGCPAASSGWSLHGVMEVTDTILAGLVEPPQDLAAFRAEIAAYDRNGDGDLCLVIRWGDQRNPKSNWYPVEYFVVSDNRSGTP
jgi:hypothetical protein